MKRKWKSGFTLVELVVILAVLAFLGIIFAPTLARTSPISKAVQCLNNHRQLGLAWRMYAEDNDGRLAYNHRGGNAGKAPGSENWAGGWLDFTGSNSDNTNTALLIDQERYHYSGYFGPYVKSPRWFKCPADKSTVNIAGQRLPRVRSISMNNRVGEGAISWLSNTAFPLYLNIREIYPPVPSRLFVLVDEHPESINDGVFFTDPDTPWQLVGYPAAHHNGGAGFAFADAHSEIHRWHDPRTMPVITPGQVVQHNVNMPGNTDVQWLQQHAAAKR